MFNLNDDQVRGGTLCLSKAGLAIGGTSTKVQFSAPNGAGVDFCIEGIAYHKADADDVWTLSGDAVNPDADTASMCLFLLGLNASGTMKVVQGDTYETADISNGLKTIQWPKMTEGYCPVGAVLVEVTSATTFTPGTTALSAAGVTDTYIDIFALPTVGLGSSYCA
jgi:hypothetical protein